MSVSLESSVSSPSIDAIEEVKVLTNLYSAEVSRTGRWRGRPDHQVGHQ